MISSNKFWFQRLGICRTRSVLVRQIVSTKPEDVAVSWTKNHEYIYNAFQQFKSTYGHCNVSNNFQVLPGDKKWPGHVKPLKLGQLFSNIRNKNQNKVIKSVLTNLGFNTEPDIKYADMRTALVKYKELEKHIQVPCDFRVPSEDCRYPEHIRGLHLGFAVHTAQVFRCYEHHHDELKQLGVNFDIISPNSVKSSVIYDATVAFKSVHGHLEVPHRFIVPSLPVYDVAAWGLQLGRALYLIRADRLHVDRKEDFLALGLNETVRSPSDFDVNYSALKVYKAIYGDLLVPHSFVVPDGDVNYPPEAWGMKLGSNVSSIRSGGTHSEHRAKLEDLGMSFEVENKQKWNFLNQIYPALEAYKAVHGDLLVPQSFVVPEGDVRFLAEAWGMKLGVIVNNIRCDNVYAKYKERLTALGFNYEVKFLDIRGFDVVYSALEAYKSVYGDLLVPFKFVVPRGDVSYPPETWGMNLGVTVSNIRNKDIYTPYKERLTALGFNYESVFDVKFDLIYSALEAYKAVHGDLLVPQSFVVPRSDVRFPHETWGMKLGSNVASIRNSGVYSEHRVKLEELGFVYKKNKKVVEID